METKRDIEVRTKRLRGVTLIELMIVVVIVGILAAVAYPSYTKYMTQSRRSDAQIALSKAAAAQEKYFTDCSAYAGTLGGTRNSCNGQLGLATTSDNGYYTLANAAGAINASTCGAITCGYTVTATPTGAQAGNGALRIDSTGAKQWDKANNNSFGYKWTDK